MTKMPIALPAGSWKLLADALSKASWATIIQDINRAGALLDDVFGPDSQIIKADSEERIPLELEPKQFETCRRCCAFWLSKGGFNPGVYARALLNAFLDEGS